MVSTRREFLISSGLLTSVLLSGADISAFAANGDNTLRIALSKQAGNLDPVVYRAIWAVQSMIFDPLVRYGQDGKIEPALAESWSVTDDGKILNFKLRHGVTFSDGTPWDADALKWNLDRWIGKEEHSWLLVSAAYESLEIIGSHEVAIHLKSAVPSALSELTTVRPGRFLSPKALAADGSFNEAIGTGPWKVVRNDAEGTELVRNDAYWGTKPAIDKVSLIVIPNARSRVDAIRSRQIDITGGIFVAAISPQDAKTLENGGVTVERATGTDTLVLGFNPERPILQDPLVRQAISLCVDRAAICEKLLNGYATPTMNLFPVVIPDSGRRLEVPSRDVDRAKKLLEQAGWTGDGVRTKDGKPLKLELVISEDAVAGSRALGEVLQSFVREAGVEIDLRLVDHVSRHDDIPQLKYDMALFITAGAPYDPHSSLTTYFLSTYRTGTDGKMFMDPAQVDPLVNAALAADDATRAAAYQAFYDWLEENHAIAPLYHASRIWAHGPRVAGFTIPATEYEMPHEGISLTNAS